MQPKLTSIDSVKSVVSSTLLLDTDWDCEGHWCVSQMPGSEPCMFNMNQLKGGERIAEEKSHQQGRKVVH